MFISNQDPGDEQNPPLIDLPSYYPHHPDCKGRGTARGSEWPTCCGSASDIEEFYDEHFDDYYDSEFDYNLAEAEEH